jgi:hypothetical protein
MFDSQKLLLIKLRNLEINVNHNWLQEAFIAIKNQSQSKKEAFDAEKARTSLSIDRGLTRLIKSRLFDAFKQIQHEAQRNQKIRDVKRNAIKCALSGKLRQFFLRWKERSGLKEINRFMDEEGPVRMEFHEEA